MSGQHRSIRASKAKQHAGWPEGLGAPVKKAAIPRRPSLVICFVVLLAALGAIGVVPASRAIARPIEENFSITLAGDFGDRLFTPSSAQIGVNQSNQVDQQVLSISIADRSGAPLLSFDFSSRAGSKRDLAVGYYGDAQRYPFMDSGRAGISMSPLGFCDDQTGNFEVRDIRHDGLAITRIWITYQRFCNNAQPADIRPVFGEIRLGYPKTAYDVSPRVVRWPAGTYPKQASYDVPIRVRRTSSSAVDVTSVSVTGRSASDFPVRQNGCTGGPTSTGCVIRVGFAPQGPGPRNAKLRVVTTAGTTYVSLDGSGGLGRSDWVLDVDHEDPTVPDEHLVLPTSFSWGEPYDLASGAYGADGIVWRAFLDLRGAATFTEGHYAYSPDGTGLQMTLSRGTAGCEIDRAAVDIANLAFTGLDKRLALLDLATDVHCRANYGETVRGRVRFHDRDDLSAPGRVANVTAVRDGGYVTLRWTNPASADLSGVLVRWYLGGISPGAADVGNAVYTGAGTTVRFAAPSTGTIAVSIWTYDQTGNVGSRAGLHVAP
jgi:hypothetical protein